MFETQEEVALALFVSHLTLKSTRLDMRPVLYRAIDGFLYSMYCDSRDGIFHRDPSFTFDPKSVELYDGT